MCVSDDVNECLENLGVCGINAQCINTYGSFNCVCEDGFEGMPPKLQCLDINECNSIDTKCDINECSDTTLCNLENMECINKVPGYECKCKAGFILNENGVCLESNVQKLCVTDEDCSANAICFDCCSSHCRCRPGFFE